ncbi:CU044_5270 family protein [Actinoallomurus liliacearum]
MNELELLRTARPDVPSYPATAQEKARAALIAAADGPGPRRRAAPSTRLRWGLAGTAAGLVVAVAAATVVQQAVAPDKNGPVPRPGRSTDGTLVNAAQVLSLAADTVDARAAVHPHPQQWAYVKKMSYSSQNGSLRGTGPGGAMVTEVWTRFDGTREAYRGDNVISRDTHRLYVSKLDHDADETTPIEDYARLAALPTDPDKLVKKLCPRTPPTADPTECVFTLADKLLRNVALPPRLQATFYRVLARLPHVIVKRDVVDLAGRHDLAVAEAYPRDFQSEQILLDPHTYKYRGERLVWTVDPNEARPAPGRTPPSSPLTSPTNAQARHEYTETLQLAAGIVDHAGIRPKP